MTVMVTNVEGRSPTLEGPTVTLQGVGITVTKQVESAFSAP